MWFGYNTNGFAHHRLEDALTILAQYGYQGVALTLDYHVLNPYDPDLPERTAQVRAQLRELGLRCVVETGARFLLDPYRKHQPTLLSQTPEERYHRLDFLRRAVDIAADLSAEAVSFWSGTPTEDVQEGELWNRLTDGCRQLADHATRKQVRLAFEPEPGMFIDTMDKFAELHRRVGHPSFGLTIDIGHLQCQGELPIGDHLRQWRDVLWNVHIEDMKRGTHDHLMFGEGEIAFDEVMDTLQEIGYPGGVCVELSRHSHDAVTTAARSIAFLRRHLSPSG